MWHEARRSEKRVHEMMDAAKKRAERRADQRSRRAGDPTQLLRVAGTKLRLAHDSAVYQSAQDLSGLSVTPYPSTLSRYQISGLRGLSVTPYPSTLSLDSRRGGLSDLPALRYFRHVFRYANAPPFFLPSCCLPSLFSPLHLAFLCFALCCFWLCLAPSAVLRVPYSSLLSLVWCGASRSTPLDGPCSIPWNNREDTLIDRYDGRAMLDFIREYDPHRHGSRELTEQQEEEEEEEACNFERYRDLVRLGWHAKTEQEGLQQVEREMEARANAQLKANRPKLPTAAAGSAATPAAGKGAYANMPFSYGSSDNNAGDCNEEEEEEDEEDEEEEEEGDGGEGGDVEEYGWMSPGGRQRLADMAERYGIEEYGRHMDLAVSALEKEKRMRQMAGNDSRPSRKERKKLARQGKEGGGQGKKQQGKGEAWKQQGLFGGGVGEDEGFGREKERRGGEEERRRGYGGERFERGLSGDVSIGSPSPASSKQSPALSRRLLAPSTVPRVAGAAGKGAEGGAKETPQERLKRLMAKQLNKHSRLGVKGGEVGWR
ncbi:unnamed protein product [Closterium sp. Naga37s-1]|nr:unnamed protein product [Closterium sp. Naga37s-1]